MNNQIRMVLMKRYEAEIEDALYKIQCIEDHNLVIPEHVDITGEIDKHLTACAAASEKLTMLKRFYSTN